MGESKNEPQYALILLSILKSGLSSASTSMGGNRSFFGKVKWGILLDSVANHTLMSSQIRNLHGVCYGMLLKVTDRLQTVTVGYKRGYGRTQDLSNPGLPR